MACDTCGKVGVRVAPLRDFYKTEKVADVCQDCETLMNKQLRKVQAVTGDIQRGLMRRFIDNLRGKFTGRAGADDGQ